MNQHPLPPDRPPGRRIVTGGNAPGVPAASTRHTETAPIIQTLPRPGEWAEFALCAQADPDAWFPDQGRTAAAARRICGTCPVRAPCLNYALSGADTWHGISTGIWGGTTPRERAAIRRGRTDKAAA